MTDNAKVVHVDRDFYPVTKDFSDSDNPQNHNHSHVDTKSSNECKSNECENRERD